MRYDNFSKRDYRRHYIDTRQKARAAVFRQSGNNRGAVLGGAVTGAFTFSDEREEKEVGKTERRGNSVAFRDSAFLLKQIHDTPVQFF